MLKNNTTVKIISIVMAICLWGFVIGEVNPTVKKTITQIPVELTNMESLAERGLAMSGDREYRTEVIVKGSRSELNELEASDIHATADVYGYDAGEHHIAVDVVVPDRISLEEVRLPEITIVFEEMDSVHLPVTVEFTGETEKDLEPAVVSLMPAEVEVKGAASVVNSVKEVRVQLDVADLSEERAVYTAEPTARNKKGGVVKNMLISAPTINVEAVLYHTKEVNLELKVTGQPDKKYGEADIAVPEKITVRGTADALKGVTSIAADSIDVSDVKKDKTIKITPELPYGVELADSSKDIGVKIEFK